MVYQWNGYNFPVKAETVGKEFERIEQENGSIQPEDIVNEARPKDSVIHPLFEWNNKKAAEAYRVEQAKNIIRCLIVKNDNTNEPATVRAYVNVNDSRKKGLFINVRSAMQNRETREIVLKAAMAELASFKRKYSTFLEFSKIFAEIDALTQRRIE